MHFRKLYSFVICLIGHRMHNKENIWNCQIFNSESFVWWCLHFIDLVEVTSILFKKECRKCSFIFYLFISLGVFLENFLFIWKRHHDRWMAANFDLCSALMVIERWGFLSVPHLLWYGTYVYNGHLQWHSNLNAAKLYFLK